ncbi:hypothetical protein [uncultured Kordia sp.]|uniref:hypothetical protein n=1 Tax=uncultured Kordia sp. TaxID=507699 RepID=UPI00261ABC2D|nr:hypothetical protein [uncultured Kordia sp.]
MLKNIENLGSVLNKAKQKAINGGVKHRPYECDSNEDCYAHELCNIRVNSCYQPT